MEVTPKELRLAVAPDRFLARNYPWDAFTALLSWWELCRFRMEAFPCEFWLETARKMLLTLRRVQRSYR
jgi:hypothetical protein